MSRGNRRQDVYLDHADRQDFLKTLAEACQQTGWQIHAYCLVSNHYHLVVETRNANLDILEMNPVLRSGASAQALTPPSSAWTFSCAF